jgi:outer membrane protein OmpA-like peptidoglycan-associated protein
MAGIRINFGAPAPMPAPVAAMPEPAPAPVPESSRTYLVFFDFDRSDLTPEAREVLRQAAEDAKNGGAIKVEVRGHADRSGSDTYNVRLSQKRAQSVRSELGRLGLPVSEIATDAAGEREPLVPTADGVKEPQNRRAEIMYVK